MDQSTYNRPVIYRVEEGNNKQWFVVHYGVHHGPFPRYEEAFMKMDTLSRDLQ